VKIAFLLAALVASACAVESFAQQAAITGHARVDKLLRQMTLDEKLAMIHGVGEDASTYQGEAGYLPGVKRLGIPPMRFADGPPGVLTRVPSIALTSTMGVAATFSRADARLNGSVIAREARSHGVGVALQPFININRDFNYSRGYNTFGEDPFLTGEMGAAEITGIQREGVMAQAKHYIGYDTDGTDVFIDDQTLHEVYVAPFAAAIQAGVSSIMCSYNRINGPYSCGNPDTLETILKGELGFQGFVTSDWGATHATDFINRGLDVEMPGPLPVSWAGPSYFENGDPPAPKPETGKPEGAVITDGGLPEEPRSKPWHDNPEPKPATDLRKLVASGTVSEDTITRAAGRVLLQMEKFGYLDGKAKLSIASSGLASLDESQNARIIEKTSIDAAVLLKNDDGALPLTAADLERLAFIGPNAAQIVAVGLTGEKAVGLPEREIGPLAALRRLAAGAHVAYAPADDMEGTPIPAQLFSHDGKPGLERKGANPTADVQINFTRSAHTELPADSTLTWAATITIPEAGEYRLHLQHLGCWATLKIDDHVVAKSRLNWIHGDVTQAGQDNIFPTTDGLDNLRANVQLTAGAHVVSLAIVPDTSHRPTQVRLNWVTPQQQAENYRAALAAAKSARTAIVFAWSRTRPVFALPGDQDKLIHDIAAVNPNTIVVLNVSQPVAMPWLNQVKAVLQMWWTGDEGGWATAKLLLGQANPGGHLPFTWPKRLEDMPASDPGHPERSNEGVNGKTTFSEGVLVGYRWLDRQKIEPLFPFGFGLSYTTFRYSELTTAPAPDGGIDVKARISNVGSRAGDAVPQVYLERPDNPPAGVQFADDTLAAFDRISLAPGESRDVAMHIPLRGLQYWSVAERRWVAPSGDRRLWIGSSSRDRRLADAVSAPETQRTRTQ
jgi:beta-glucosidase